MNMSEVHLSIVIPAYNEEKKLPNTLPKIYDYLKKQSYNWEILIVSDGSKDNTAQVVKDLSSQIENLRLIDNKENHGKGYVVKQGMLSAKGKYRLFTDADNSTSIEQIEKMWPEFEQGYEVIIGSRDIEGAKLAVSQPWWRLMIGNAFNLLVQIMCGLWGIPDTQCGFKGFTREAAEDIFSRTRIARFAFDAEMLVIAKKMKYKIKEIPVFWVNDKRSSVKFKSMVKMAIDLFQIRLNMIKGIYEK